MFAPKNKSLASQFTLLTPISVHSTHIHRLYNMRFKLSGIKSLLCSQQNAFMSNERKAKQRKRERGGGGSAKRSRNFWDSDKNGVYRGCQFRHCLTKQLALYLISFNLVQGAGGGQGERLVFKLYISWGAHFYRNFCFLSDVLWNVD